MTGALEQQEAAVDATTSAVETKTTAKGGSTSPARSDKSSDSEGRPVREKLKETRIDAQATSDPIPSSDQPTNDISNGTAKMADQSASGSDSERGRLRRKRSREDFEDEAEADKHPEKKVEVGERHARKKSRDITKDDLPTKPAPSTISRIEENDAEMTSPDKKTSTSAVSDKASGADTSPKNKRTRDQAEDGTETAVESLTNASANGKPVEKAEDERNTKRLRDKDDVQPAVEAAVPASKIPPGSGFANTSTASPFAAMSPKPQASKSSEKPDALPQTSDDKFKSSGFGSFASSAASPFGGLASSKASSSSPFAAASGSKSSSFAGSASPSAAPATGFGALGGTSKSAFGGSTFGGSLGGGFGSLGGAKSGLSSFATPGTLEIKGLKAKSDKPFGASANDEASDEEDGDVEDTEKDAKDEEQRSSQPFLSQQQPHETGEEGEMTAWAGRAKLYTMAGETGNRGWKERGVGTFKFNVTVEEPKKARFVLRADGTHRLLLNAAVNQQLVFGGDSQGAKPKDGRLLFNSPTSDGEIEMHLLKLKSERAVELWEEVTKVQETELFSLPMDMPNPLTNYIYARWLEEGRMRVSKIALEKQHMAQTSRKREWDGSTSEKEEEDDGENSVDGGRDGDGEDHPNMHLRWTWSELQP
ncbi:Nn.00g023090.m01.CDS01 [Neocucurbitaria sp. VM-36]